MNNSIVYSKMAGKNEHFLKFIVEDGSMFGMDDLKTIAERIIEFFDENIVLSYNTTFTPVEIYEDVDVVSEYPCTVMINGTVEYYDKNTKITMHTESEDYDVDCDDATGLEVVIENIEDMICYLLDDNIPTTCEIVISAEAESAEGGGK